MPKINLLPKNVAELIAAGEVVERPASVIKELVENSIDAGASVITVEINRGGITYIRVTDNGCGIEYSDVLTAFLRHATSKIKIENDLNSIGTLGFRGEALAAVSSVAKVEMLTASKNSDFGTHYVIEGGQEKLYEESGCPNGTTIIIRDIFYNTPARMKFLKKDVSEANACASVVERIALSHPEVSFKFIREGKVTLNTSGDSNIKSAVYSVLGRDFANSLIDVKDNLAGIDVLGLCCRPISCRPTRNNQFTFLNGRLVRSGTVVAAVEQAYKNSAMIGKFPAFVLYLSVPLDTVDVNVHPAKTEVRFSDEKRVFDAVYSAIKNALLNGDTRPQAKLNTPSFSNFDHITAREYQQDKIQTETVAEKVYPIDLGLHKPKTEAVFKQNINNFMNRYSYADQSGGEIDYNGKKQLDNNTDKFEAKKEFPVKITEEVEQKVDIIPNQDEEIIIIGEAFSTYIIAQMGDSIYMIDKHAAHERIIFNQLMKKENTQIQALLTPLNVSLAIDEYDAIIQNLELLEQSGFEIEDFGNSTVLVRAIPSTLTREDILSLISEIAFGLMKNNKVSSEKLENLYHTVACKAAIKAGNRTSTVEMHKLAERVLLEKDIMYCPHGRPVAFEVKRKDLEKQFGRIQ